MQDIRLAFRRWRRQPGFAITAVVTLALGLGANIAIFTLVYTLLVRSLPVDRPDELYRLGDTNDCCVNSGLPGQGRFSLFSYRLFAALHDSIRPDFVELAAFQATTQPIGVRRRGGVGVSIPAQYVSANYFEMFGVRPAAGRLLQKDDDRPDAPPAVVISHQTWVEHFGQDPALVGSAVLVSGRPMTVVGVTDSTFFGDTIRPTPAGIWIPLGQEPPLRAPASLIERPDQNFLYAIGRLRRGVDPDAVAARATAMLRQWLTAQSFLDGPQRQQIPQQHIVVVPAGGGVPILRAQFGQALTILFVTSGLVLLIATANLANLLLARADRGQASIRVALGASPSRLIRQSLVEGVALAALGGIVGIWIAAAGTRTLLTLAFPGATFVPVEVMPSIAVWAFAMGLAIATGALFSAGPAWAMSRLAPLDALSGVGRSGSLRSFVPRRSLAIAQVALSFVLISGAGLLASSLAQLERQQLGFEPESRTLVRLNPPALAGQRERIIGLYGAMRDRLLAIPGVADATYALYTPMEGNNWSSGISMAGRPAGDGPPLNSSWNRVGPRYFETVGTRLLRGRLFDDRDMLGGTQAVVVNDAFRRQFFEHREALGARLGIGDPSHAADYEIVGVVDDVRYTAPRQPVRPMIFLPAFSTVAYDNPSMANVQARSLLFRVVVIRATTDLGTLEPAIRRALADVDADLQVIRVLTLTEQVRSNFRIERLMSRLTSLYGLLALLVAAIGLYGVTAFSVAQRTREIGVRMALGADRARIVRTVMRGPLLQAIAGLVIGVPLSLAAGRAIAAHLYGVDAGDPTIFGTAIVVLLVSMAAAAIIPGLRAASIDPTRALRGDT
jgi:predicted permease